MEKQNEQSVREVVLSGRLRTLAEMITPGNIVADIGCDHGFLSVYLVQQGISPHVIAADVRKGPLEGAKLHIAQAGLESYIETRLSDGVKALMPGEAQTMVCAGMGGRLMQQILTDCPDTVAAFRELILQPQSELYEFRKFLRRQGWTVLDEKIVWEDGKYYFPIKVGIAGKKGSGKKELHRDVSETDRTTEEDSVLQRLYDKYGRLLLLRREPVLKEYLQKCLEECRKVEASILMNLEQSKNRQRLEESLAATREETGDLMRALGQYETDSTLS